MLKEMPPLILFKEVPRTDLTPKFADRLVHTMDGANAGELFGHAAGTLFAVELTWKGVGESSTIGILKFKRTAPGSMSQTVDLDFLKDWAVLGPETVQELVERTKLAPEEFRKLLS